VQLFSEEIEIDISLVQTEAGVGKFSVDILAEEDNTERKIIIEKQLETSDHHHLGKVITYASGVDADMYSDDSVHLFQSYSSACSKIIRPVFFPPRNTSTPVGQLPLPSRFSGALSRRQRRIVAS